MVLLAFTNPEALVRLFTSQVLLLGLFSPCSLIYLVLSQDSNVVLSPSDPDACVGDNVTFTCEMKDDARGNSAAKDNSTALVLLRNGQTVSENETSIEDILQVLYIQSVTVHDNQTLVRCCLHDCSNTIGQASVMFVYDKPSNVSNFSCLAYNWDENMTCQWSHEERRRYKQFSCKWKYETLNMRRVPCPHLTGQNQSTWKDQRFDGKLIDIQIYMENPGCRNSVTQNFLINTSDIVKPAPVDELRAQTVNSSCMYLNWTHQKRFKKKKFNLSYKASNGRGDRVILPDVHRQNLTVCSLYPYTEYEFEVRVHPDGASGYWSEPVLKTAQTLADVPGSSPNVTNSCYLSRESACKEQNLRKVTVYWQPLSATTWNGPEPEIQILIQPADTEGNQNHIIHDSVAQVTLDLHCHQQYTVSLQAGNREGLSDEVSRVVIPKTTADLPSTDFVKIEMKQPPGSRLMENTTDVYFQWEDYRTENDDQFTYRLYWCLKSAGQCSGQAKWLQLDNDTTSYSQIIKQPEEYVFSIAVETMKSGSGGVKWESCIYTKGATPDVPTGLEVSAGSKDNTLEIKWQLLLCQSGSPYIDNYKIFFCKRGESYVDKDYELVHSTFSSWSLRNLHTDVEYEVRIQALSEGKKGPVSEPVYGTPVSGALKTGEIVVITVGSIFGLPLLVLGVIMFISKIHQCRKRLSYRVPIQVPQIVSSVTVPLNIRFANDENSTSNVGSAVFDRSNSNDSGIYDVVKNVERSPSLRQSCIPEDYIRLEQSCLPQKDTDEAGIPESLGILAVGTVQPVILQTGFVQQTLSDDCCHDVHHNLDEESEEIQSYTRVGSVNSMHRLPGMNIETTISSDRLGSNTSQCSNVSTSEQPSRSQTFNDSQSHHMPSNNRTLILPLQSDDLSMSQAKGLIPPTTSALTLAKVPSPRPSLIVETTLEKQGLIQCPVSAPPQNSASAISDEETPYQPVSLAQSPPQTLTQNDLTTTLCTSNAYDCIACSSDADCRSADSQVPAIWPNVLDEQHNVPNYVSCPSVEADMLTVKLAEPAVSSVVSSVPSAVVSQQVTNDSPDTGHCTMSTPNSKRQNIEPTDIGIPLLHASKRLLSPDRLSPTASVAIRSITSTVPGSAVDCYVSQDQAQGLIPLSHTRDIQTQRLSISDGFSTSDKFDSMNVTLNNYYCPLPTDTHALPTVSTQSASDNCVNVPLLYVTTSSSAQCPCPVPSAVSSRTYTTGSIRSNYMPVSLAERPATTFSDKHTQPSVSVSTSISGHNVRAVSDTEEYPVSPLTESRTEAVMSAAAESIINDNTEQSLHQTVVVSDNRIQKLPTKYQSVTSDVPLTVSEATNAERTDYIYPSVAMQKIPL